MELSTSHFSLLIGKKLALKPPSPTRTSRLAHLTLKSCQFVIMRLVLSCLVFFNTHVGSTNSRGTSLDCWH